MFPPRDQSRRDFLSVVAGSTVAAIAPTVSASVFDSFPLARICAPRLTFSSTPHPG
jgi:hypothetical protein